MTSRENLLPEPQDPEKQPIINSPFHPPQYHWQLNSDTMAFAPAAPGRRISQNMPPVAGTRNTPRGPTMPGYFGIIWEEMELVNWIRREVQDWKDRGYCSVTSTTQQLIDHWTSSPDCNMYFAQLDAVLTHIYLREIAPTEITKELNRTNRQYNDDSLVAKAFRVGSAA